MVHFSFKTIESEPTKVRVGMYHSIHTESCEQNYRVCCIEAGQRSPQNTLGIDFINGPRAGLGSYPSSTRPCAHFHILLNRRLPERRKMFPRLQIPGNG